MSAPEFIQKYVSKDGSVALWDRGGVDWRAAPEPFPIHRCRIQTKGFINYFTFVARCACGAISHDGRHWKERNSR